MRILIILFLCLPVFSSEFQELSEVASKYLIKNSNEKEDQKWVKSYQSSYETAVNDNENTTEQIYFQRRIIDWAASKRNKFKNLEDIDDKTLIEGCRYFKLMNEKNLELPGQIREELTSENLDKFLDFLRKRL